jgi:hypothetical protein
MLLTDAKNSFSFFVLAKLICLSLMVFMDLPLEWHEDFHDRPPSNTMKATSA